jgi:hypothetical protein
MCDAIVCVYDAKHVSLMQEGERDGEGGGIARFNGPAGVAAAADGVIYTVDSNR